MGVKLSSKSELTRLDAAAALAMLVREIAEDVVIYATAGSDSEMVHQTKLLPSRRGFALRDSIVSALHTLGGGGIFLTQCTEYIQEKEGAVDTLIVISDSQDTDRHRTPNDAFAFGKYNYLVDISCERYGVAFNKFQQINGFSEALIDYIIADQQFTNIQQ